MQKLKLVSVSILSLLCLIIILQNTGAVETKLLFMSMTMPLAFLLFLTALLGFLVGVLVSYRTLRKHEPASAPTPNARATKSGP